MRPVIQIQIHGIHGDCRIWHSRQPLTDKPLEWVQRNWSNDELSPTGELLADELFKIDGVTEFFLKIYSLHVQKSPAFDWDEIEPAVTSLLQRLVGS